MTSRLETSVSDSKWSDPLEKRTEGTPPTVQDHPSTKEGSQLKGNARTITPFFKEGAKPSAEMKLGEIGALPTGAFDYKEESKQDHYKQRIIDPKVNTNANMPHLSTKMPEARRPIVSDFPSEHSRRSGVKVDPIEARRFRSVETRPISTSDYLAESVKRHRDADASQVLHPHIRAKEGDANQPWNKPGWAPPKVKDEGLKELDELKLRIETLQKAANEKPKFDDLDALRKKARELEERAKHRDSYKGVESDIVKGKPDPVPDMYKSQQDVSSATWQFNTQHSFSPRSVVSVNGAKEDDEKKAAAARSIMKRKELESREQMMGGEERGGESRAVKTYTRSQSNISHAPRVTETVQRFEETRRTEEVERRVQRRERRDRRSRHHSSSRGHEWQSGGWERSGMESGRSLAAAEAGQQVSARMVDGRMVRYERRKMTADEMNAAVRHAYNAVEQAYRDIDERGRSASLSRGGFAGYLPSNEEYHRQQSTRREQSMGRNDDRWGQEQRSGLAHARYGSMSDSLRRGELKYIPNGDVRERSESRGAGGRSSMHKSYSTRDVFNGDKFHDDRRSQASWRNSGGQHSPFVEFPPTLPRRVREDMDGYRPVSKSRSYADWDDQGRAGWVQQHHQQGGRGEDMSRLEAEFRDSLLMPMPNGNMHERDHRTENIPGGYETYAKENKANSGRRVDRYGNPVDFNEASHEYSYKREQQHDGGFDNRRHR